MINYRVDDLDALVAQLRAHGVTIVKGPEADVNGSFACILDPDSNKLELLATQGARRAAGGAVSPTGRTRPGEPRDRPYYRMRQHLSAPEPHAGEPMRSRQRARWGRFVSNKKPMPPRCASPLERLREQRRTKTVEETAAPSAALAASPHSSSASSAHSHRP